LFGFPNQIKSRECCIRADASWSFLSAKGFKNTFRCCPNSSENFLDFSGISSHFPEIILFVRRLQKLFHEHQILYLDCSSSNLPLGIFLELFGIFKYFSWLL
jgi:hypothetical protein